MMKKILISISTILFVFTLIGCQSSTRKLGEDAVAEYDSNPLSVEVPASATQEQAINMAESVLIGREWKVTSKSDDQVVGNLVHRGFDATATIKSEGSKLVIYSQAVHTDKHSGEAKPAVPLGWLKNLQSDLVKQLN